MFTFIIDLFLWLLAVVTGSATSQEFATNQSIIRPINGTEVWAFCGVHPDATNAALAVRSLAIDAGTDATFGPCLPPDWSTYTTANPGQRYAEPIVYLRLLALNSSVGMQTIVYDARLWNDDSNVRQTAIDYWMPYTSHIAAWDMGDEFDPKYSDWAILLHRWEIMKTNIEPVTGVEPYTNHFGVEEVLHTATRDLGHGVLSFDAYDEELAMELTKTFTNSCDILVVAVNALSFGPFAPTAESVESLMHRLDNAGADQFLIFGGAYPYLSDLSPDPTYGNGSSLIDSTGMPTELAHAVLSGSQ